MRKAHNRIEMEGKQYNSWEVISHLETIEKIPYYKCICKGCEKEYRVDGRNIRSGRSKECVECAHKTTSRKITNKPRTKRTLEEMAAVYITKKIKGNANTRKIEFQLDPTFVYKMSKLNCTYCKRAPVLKGNIFTGYSLSKKIEEQGNIGWNGLDRVDSSKGYTIDNVVPACMECNVIKGTKTVEEFKALIKRIYEGMFL